MKKPFDLRSLPLLAVAALVPAACGGKVVVDSGMGSGASSSATGCAAISAGCVSLCSNAACAAVEGGSDCLDRCKQLYCFATTCSTEFADLLLCAGDAAGCDAGQCQSQASAVYACCGLNVAACTPPSSASSSGG